MSESRQRLLPTSPWPAPPSRRSALLALASVTSLVQARPSPHQTPLMQATRYEPGQPVDGFWVSEKLDGVRARWDGQRLWTRSGRAIHAPPHFTQSWPSLMLDGELWSGPGQFAQSVAAVRDGPSSSAWQGLRMMAFDAPELPDPFGTPGGRLHQLQAAIEQSKATDAQVAGHLQAVAQQPVTSVAQVKAWLDEVLAQGGEGLILHRASGLYRSGRSPDVLKYKAFEDAEAQVVQVLPGKGAWRGQAGALLVQTQEGHRLRLGSGLPEALRLDPPAVGSWVSFRYQGLHPGGVPRFATFLRVVPDISL
ncbi:DNA ligase [Curvibacter sp. RS43]|uniref:DNA ligase n=1 Tax=Curvibacter microcysteis TaxID=3026419 RepID=A0ABT5MGX5_9BURK|nr:MULTISPECIES: DNA ligase [unclassified Curvibacter]MDD0809969.1 DNA ligase [Curvibacter sp. RS43]MDD0815144.1 DNA ligase [Curvibacter sp. HBC28]